MKKRMLLTVLSVFTVLMLISSIVVRSYASLTDDKSDVQNKINEAKNALNDISDDKDEAETELQKLTTQVTEAQKQLDTLAAQIDELNDTIDAKQKEIEDEEAEIEKTDNLLKERMVALYEIGETSYLDVLFNSENILDFLSNYSMIQQIVETDSALIDELEAKKQQLETDKVNLEENKAKVVSAKADQEVKRAQLSALQEKKQSEINKLSADEKAKQAELDAYNAKLKEIDDAIAEALRKAQEEEKKNNATNGGNGSSFDGTFVWPLDYSPRRVTSRMKYRWGRWHKGIDIGTNAEIGKRVIAAASGTVIYSAYQAGSSSSAGYGNYLIIYHGNGYCSLYAHMNSKAVSTGQKVSQGQLIGYSGNTGGVAPHLHFEIRKATSIGDFFGKNWKDPLDYLPGGYTIVD